MKRSDIDRSLHEADERMRARGVVLPPFAYRTPETFVARAEETRHIVDARCWWGIEHDREHDVRMAWTTHYANANDRLNGLIPFVRGSGRDPRARGESAAERDTLRP